ncbi:hypothetical protein Tco_1215970 [Tanacetum coccineum]
MDLLSEVRCEFQLSLISKGDRIIKEQEYKAADRRQMSSYIRETRSIETDITKIVVVILSKDNEFRPKTRIDSFKAQLNKKSNVNADVLAQIQKKGVLQLTALKNERKTFASSTTKVESEPPNGSNADIPNQCESEQALNVSACTLLSTADQASVFMKMTSVHISSGLVLHQMTSDHNRSELGIQDHSNEQSSSKLVPKVVP